MTSFTLAEVLIVLGIIGLIADMTIPTLHQEFKEKVTIAQIQKGYSTFENAFRMSVAENGEPKTWGFGTQIIGATKEGSDFLLNKFAPYLNIVKYCGTHSKCDLPADEVPEQTNYSSYALLADGSIISFFLDGGNCPGKVGTTPALSTECGQIFWDVNGAKAPNKEGYDVFGFYLTNLGIVPQGSQAETHVYSFDKGCLVPFSNGGRRGCTAWVIYSGNMDYLHCSDLSWDGSHYCK